MGTLESLLAFRVRLGRISGIVINLHWSLFLVGIYFLVQFRAQPKLGVLFLLALFGSILLHELGHCWGARQVGGQAREVILWPLGGLAMINTPMAPWPCFFSTIMGPLVNLGIALAVLPLFWLMGGELAWLLPGHFAPSLSLGLEFLLILLEINLFLLIFNVIPAYPMDGGRILHSALWTRVGFHRALAISCVAAMVCAGLMVALGLVNHYFLLSAIGVFVFFEAMRERARLKYGLYDDLLMQSALPWQADAYDYASNPESPPQPSRLQRWLARRRRRREQARARARSELRLRLDEVLARVSDSGLGSLSQKDRHFLKQASATLRREQEEPRDAAGKPGS